MTHLAISKNTGSQLSACVVIPNFNHGKELPATITAIEEFGLPCLIVDDGSDEFTRTVLRDLAQRFSWVEVLYRHDNGGKGAAVSTGLREAFSRGYTHALQIDADGQHNIKDIPRLLAVSTSAPHALVLAQPIFDASVPKVRLIGRQITRVLVWLQTRSFEIQDVLCGFRVYPLQETVRLLDAESIGQRMDFDLEIAVKLFWRGVQTLGVPSPVKYHPEGLSNFHYLDDNVRLAKAHGRLLWSSLFARRHKVQRESHWTRLNERGTLFALRVLIFVRILLGNRLSHALCYPVSVYFFLTGTKARRASIDYFRRILPALSDGGRRSLHLHSYMHFVSFSQALVDKLAAWKGSKEMFDVSWSNRDLATSLVASGRGAVIVSAHFGNLEVIRAKSVFGGHIVINALMFTKHAENYNRILKQLNPNSHIHVIATEQVGSDLITRLRDAIERGEIVTILADRTTEGAPSKAKSFEFLGEQASFPTGPFLLAAMLDCPLLSVFCSRGSDKRYSVRLSKLADRLEFSRARRDESISKVMQAYVSQLEREVRLSPYEWYNFYDFWAAVGEIDR